MTTTFLQFTVYTYSQHILMSRLTRKSTIAMAPVSQDSNPRCELHSSLLQVGDRKLIYGIPPPLNPKYIEALKLYFPHANSYRYAGCLMSPLKVESTAYCNSCREAEKQWKLNSIEQCDLPETISWNDY